MIRVVLAIVLSALLAARLAAQPASFSTFGTACSDPNGRTLTIGHRGLPQIGTTFAITYAGPNFTGNSFQQRARPWLVLGFGRTATLIPPLFRLQPTDCFLYNSAEIPVPMPPDPNQPVYLSSFSLTVPGDSTLIGAQLFAQWASVFEQCGVARCDVEWILTSQGAVLTIGT